MYRPSRPAEEVRRSLARELVEKVFDGSSLALVQTLVRNEDLSDKELAEIRQLIDAANDDGNDD